MTSSRAPATAGHRPAVRPRVALLLDTPDWAFANIAAQLQRHLADQFDFVQLPVSWFGSLPRALQLADGARLIHFFWREHITQLDWPEVRRELKLTYGSEELGLARLTGGARLTTCVFDHLYLLPDELADRGNRFRRLGVHYGTASSRLLDLYRSVEAMPPPSAVLRDGVDRARFVPRDPARFAGAGRTRDLVVGWTGNSAFQGLGEDAKGVNTIIRPAIDALRGRGRRIRLEAVDRAVEHRPHAAMPAFYDAIDVYCCASVAEGTPNPVLEAMACGLAVVSTDVGIVPEAFGTLQRDFLLQERSTAALEAALEALLAEPERLAALGRENVASSAAWDWSVRTASYADFFNQQLGRQ
jgi:glycosyltransferase involved in cell wall biosynthesis